MNMKAWGREGGREGGRGGKEELEKCQMFKKGGHRKIWVSF